MKNLKKITGIQWCLNAFIIAFFILINCSISIKTFAQTDACADATLITLSGSTPFVSTFSNVGATTDNNGSCGTGIGKPNFNKWFKVVGDGNWMVAAGCGSEKNPVISVFTSSCGGTVAGNCNSSSGCNGDDKAYSTWCSTNGTTYYISVGTYSTNSAYCGNLTLTVQNSTLSTPTAVSAQHPSICGGGSTYLYATPAGNTQNFDGHNTNNTVMWYAGGCGTGPSLGTGTISVSPTTTTTYYVRTQSGFCTASSSCASVTVTVAPTPAPTAVTPGSTLNICKGDSVKLNATSAGNTIYWYKVPSGGTSIGTSASGEDFYVTPEASSTYDYVYYYAEAHTPTDCISPRTSTAVISVYSLDLSTSVAGYTITANLAGATSYKWINCNTNLPVPNETSQSFTATSDGNYAVVITNNGCTDTSECVNMINVGMPESNKENKINIYPNPANDQITVQISSNLLGASYTISDKIGRTVMTGQINSERSDINISALPKGQYLLKFNDKNMQSFDVMKK